MTTIAAFLCLIFILDGLRLRGRARSLAPLPDSDRPVRDDHRFLFPEGVELSEETKRAASRYADAAGLEVLDLVPADYPGTDLLGLLELVDPKTYRGQPSLPARTAAAAILVTEGCLERAGPLAVSYLDGGARDRAEFVHAANELKRCAPRDTSLAVAPQLKHIPLSHSERFGVLRALLGEVAGLALILQGAIFSFIALLLWRETGWGITTLACFHAQALLGLSGLPWARSQMWSLACLRYPLEVSALYKTVTRSTHQPKDQSKAQGMVEHLPPHRAEGALSMKDLSITAKYTCECWVFGKFECAELLATEETKLVFDVTNAVLDLTSSKAQPSLPHSLVQRHAMIDRLLNDWLRTQSGEAQVLELAAGFSARGLRFTEDPHITYTEVDLHSVLGKKRELLARTCAGQEATLRENLRYVAGDLTHLDLSALIDPSRPVFIITEGLCMYLETDAQRILWQRLASLCGQSGSEYVFDLVPSCEEPQSSRAGKVLDLGLRLMTGGRRFAKNERTRAELTKDLLEAGFDSVKTHDPKGQLDRWNLPHTRVPTQQLLFHARAGAGSRS